MSRHLKRDLQHAGLYGLAADLERVGVAPWSLRRAAVMANAIGVATIQVRNATKPEHFLFRAAGGALGHDQLELCNVLRRIARTAHDLIGTTCAHTDAHIIETEAPVGPECGRPAALVIIWQDGRSSPGCELHGPETLVPDTDPGVVCTVALEQGAP